MFNILERAVSVWVIPVFILAFSLVSPPPGNAAAGSGSPQDKIVEEVEVTAAEVPVRVFHKGEPVTDLRKQDFKLFVGDRETPITGFYQLRKKINLPSQQPRLFVLMFNVVDYNLDIDNTLDRFFNLILRPKDRLMIISNHFYLNDVVVVDPQMEKEKVKSILKLEKNRTEQKLKMMEVRIRSLVRKYKDRTNRGIGLKQANANDFINDYLALVQEFKTLYLNMATDKYIRLAQYLNSLTVDKWVLGFYQIGRFFKPKFGSQFFQDLMDSGDETTGDFTSFEAFRIYEKMQEATSAQENTLPMEDLVKLYTNTGATFHTVMMKQGEFVRSEFAGDLKYVNVVAESFELLKKLAVKTGGKLYNADEIDIFYQYMVTAEDVHYILTYNPTTSGIKKKKKKKQSPQLKVTVEHPNYRVFYDDKKRGGYFRRVMERKRLSVPIPRIRIDYVVYENQMLSFVVSNFKVKDPPKTAATGQSTGTEAPPAMVKLPVRIQVFNAKSESLFDGVQMFQLGEADARGGRVKLQVRFPKVPPGEYDLFIWVGDPLTGKRDLAIKPIKIR